MAMSEKDKQMLFYGLPVVVLGALFWFGYYDTNSWWNTYQAMGAEITEKDTELHEAMEQQKNLDALQAEVDAMTQELEVAERLLPKENDVRGLLEKIPALAIESGIPKEAMSSINFSSQSSHEQYKEWPIALQFTQVTFGQMVELLNRFEKFERLLDVTNLPLTVLSAEENTLTLALTINVYVFKEEVPVDAAPAE
jgi:Tfp pilus assembly protein PilO